MNDWLKDRPTLAFLLNATLAILAVFITFKLNSWAADKEKVENRLTTLETQKATYIYVDKNDKQLSDQVIKIEFKLDKKASKEDINLVREDIRDLRKLIIEQLRN